MSGLERELESELHRVLDPVAAMPIPPRRTPIGRTRMRTLVGGAGAVLSVKLLTGVAVAAAAVTVAGAATTGSVNPVDWGQQVSQHVADCKDKLTDGQHGIGDCVSSFESQHGAAAVASGARPSVKGGGSSNAHGNNSNANGHAKDKSKDHPLPPKTGPTARPTIEPEPSDPPNHPTVTIPPQR